MMLAEDSEISPHLKQSATVYDLQWPVAHFFCKLLIMFQYICTCLFYRNKHRSSNKVWKKLAVFFNSYIMLIIINNLLL